MQPTASLAPFALSPAPFRQDLKAPGKPKGPAAPPGPSSTRLPDPPLRARHPAGGGLVARACAVDVSTADWCGIASARVRELREKWELASGLDAKRLPADPALRRKRLEARTTELLIYQGEVATELDKTLHAFERREQYRARLPAFQRKGAQASVPIALDPSVEARFSGLQRSVDEELSKALEQLVELPLDLPRDPVAAAQALLRDETHWRLALEHHARPLPDLTRTERLALGFSDACLDQRCALEGQARRLQASGRPAARAQVRLCEGLVHQLDDCVEDLGRRVAGNRDDDCKAWSSASVRQRFMAACITPAGPGGECGSPLTDGRVLAMRLGGLDAPQDAREQFLASWVACAAGHEGPEVPESLALLLEGFGFVVERQLTADSGFIRDAVRAILRHWATEPGAQDRSATLEAMGRLCFVLVESLGATGMPIEWVDDLTAHLRPAPGQPAGVAPPVRDASRWLRDGEVDWLREVFLLAAEGDDMSPALEAGSGPQSPASRPKPGPEPGPGPSQPRG